MRHHILTRRLVTVAAALALLAAGCGSGPADPAPEPPATTVSPNAEPPVHPDPEPAAPQPTTPEEEPAPEADPEPAAPQPTTPEEEPAPAVDPEPAAPQPTAPDAERDPDPATAQAAASASESEDLTAPEHGSENLVAHEPEDLAEPEAAPGFVPEDLVEPGLEVAPCPEGEHRHGDEPCHYDDPEPELVQAESQPEIAIVEIEDEPDSDEVHPHTTDTIPEPPPASGAFPSARGEQPTIAWQVHVSGVVDGARPLPTFTPVVQAWSDWCFFDWATRQANTQATRQQCAIQLSLIGMATELLGITDQCATTQYRGQLEMLTGEGEFDFATDFGRVGWHACPSVIDPDPSDDIASPYFDAERYEASLMPDDDCMRASWAAEVYFHEQGIWMAEWRC